jgi:HEPN domain-containing protein
MPYDARRIGDTQAWLIKAEKDLRAGEASLGAQEPLPEDAMFHAQQSSEKALKAFLAWHDEPFRKTHDLREIGTQCVAHDPSLGAVCERAELLTPFAWQFRYPDDSSPDPSISDARKALDLAREVYVAVLARLPGEAHP